MCVGGERKCYILIIIRQISYFFINVKLQLNVNLTIIRLKIGYITPKRKRKESTLVSNDNEDNAQNFISF